MYNFSRIQLHSWRQFAEVDINLNNQVTVLTGQNGCGKTTILNILSHHFGWNVQFISTPFWGKEKSKQFWSDVQEARYKELNTGNSSTMVGSIHYDNSVE